MLASIRAPVLTICQIVIVLTVLGKAYAFCPPFFSRDKSCTCFAYLDGAVIKCRGPKSTAAVEKLKAMPVPPEIRELALENANIVEIGPRAFRNLRIKTLILDDNRIKAIHPDALRGLENSLVSLSLAHNKLTEIPTDALTGLNALLVLNLQCNNIGNIYQPVFRNVSRLIELNLACNQICKITGPAFESVKDTMQSLILDQNCLKEIPAEALRNFKQLLALHLQYNEITSIDKLQLMNMLSLLLIRLTGNKIKIIDRYGFNNVPNLRYLFLNHNELMSVEPNTLQQFKYLEVIDLSYNNIAEISTNAFQGLEHLMQLNLEGNSLKDIAPGAFSHTPLLLLLMGHNCLTAVNQQMFQGIPFLKQLSLTDNNIKIVQPFAFAGLPTLNVLDLSKNKLQNLEPTSVTASGQATVLVQENPMVCGQNGYHIIQNNQPILLINETNAICKSKKISQEDICPKKRQNDEIPPCCPNTTSRPSVSKTTQEPQLFSQFTPTTTTSHRTVSPNPHNEEQEEEDTVDVTGETEKYGSTVDDETSENAPTVPATKASTPKFSVNMERFWRFTAPPPRTPKPAPASEPTTEDDDGEGASAASTDDNVESTNEVTEKQPLLRVTTAPQTNPRSKQEVEEEKDLPAWMRLSQKDHFGLPHEPPRMAKSNNVGPEQGTLTLAPALRNDGVHARRPQLQAPDEDANVPPNGFGPPLLPNSAPAFNRQQQGPPAFQPQRNQVALPPGTAPQHFVSPPQFPQFQGNQQRFPNERTNRVQVEQGGQQFQPRIQQQGFQQPFNQLSGRQNFQGPFHVQQRPQGLQQSQAGQVQQQIHLQPPQGTFGQAQQPQFQSVQQQRTSLQAFEGQQTPAPQQPQFVARPPPPHPELPEQQQPAPQIEQISQQRAPVALEPREEVQPEISHPPTLLQNVQPTVAQAQQPPPPQPPVSSQQGQQPQQVAQAPDQQTNLPPVQVQQQPNSQDQQQRPESSNQSPNFNGQQHFLALPRQPPPAAQIPQPQQTVPQKVTPFVAPAPTFEKEPQKPDIDQPARRPLQQQRFQRFNTQQFQQFHSRQFQSAPDQQLRTENQADQNQQVQQHLAQPVPPSFGPEQPGKK